MSKTDKTDPYWVKVLHTKNRDEWHGMSCNGDNCDIEGSIGPWRREYPGTRREYRTITRTVTVPNPDYDPTITDWYAPNRYTRTIDVERTYTYRVAVYDGPRCRYYLTNGEDRVAYRRCNCCGRGVNGVAHSRATERTILHDLRRRYNSGDEVDDYLFDTDCPWGEKEW